MRRSIIGILLALTLVCNAWADGDKDAAVTVLAKADSSWNGKALPAYPVGPAEVTILKIVIPPGARLPLHSHPVINAGVLLSGQLSVFTDKDEKLLLQAGDAIVEVVDTWHFGKNEGNTPAEIVVFYAGVKGRPITVSSKSP